MQPNRGDLCYLIDIVDVLCDDGKLSIPESESLIWSILEKPIPQ